MDKTGLVTSSTIGAANRSTRFKHFLDVFENHRLALDHLHLTIHNSKGANLDAGENSRTTLCPFGVSSWLCKLPDPTQYHAGEDDLVYECARSPDGGIQDEV
jgi:hypothetical protein